MVFIRFHAKPSVMKHAAALLLSLTLCGTATATDSPDLYPDVEYDTPLDEAGLIRVFKGQTHAGSYTFLNRDIQTFAFTETTADDGSVLHLQADKADTGQWRVQADIICYDYDDPGLTQACFRIYQRGNCYYHYQVSTRGVSRYGFTARSVIQGERPNCEPSLV